MRRNSFTLLELIAVIAILMIIVALSGAYLRRDRKVAALTQAMQEFRLFSARGRAATMTDGVRRKLVYYPNEQLFKIERADELLASGVMCRAEDVDAEEKKAYVILYVLEEDEENAAAGDDENEESHISPEEAEAIEERKNKWRFPAGLELEYDSDGISELADDEGLELWQFAPDGSARLHQILVVELNGTKQTLTVDDFTGLVTVKDGDIRDEEDLES